MEQANFDAVDHYIAQLLAPEDSALRAVEPSLTEAGIPQMSVSANQGKFLQLLALLCRAERILELGTLGGYSTIWMARALPEGGRLVSLEADPGYAEVAWKNIVAAGLSEKVEIRVGKALELLPQLEAENAGPFDLVFIDADKPPYTEYFQFALRLSRPGTLIVADNVIRNGQVLDAQTTDAKVAGVQRFNAMLASEPAVEATILQMVGSKEWDGMALAVVKKPT
ncbi:MAG: O-methyltransferase [Saprospiraceae bacterium]|nr:O-methyltransferase [Saprospiraceae bacterium]